MLTVKYRGERVLLAIMAGKSVCQLWHQDREQIARLYKNRGYDFVGLWVIETRNGLNLHCIMHVPADKAFRRELADVLCRIGNMHVPPHRSALHMLRTKNSGHTCHLLRIRPEVAYDETGRTGYWGLVDYTSKTLWKLNPYYRPRLSTPRVPGARPLRIKIGKRNGKNFRPVNRKL
jgi:hypothetical protein